jgi:hypothetical protein
MKSCIIPNACHVVIAHLRASVGVKSLVRVTNEGQAGGIFVVAGLCSLSSVRSARVVLVNLIDGEVGCVDVRVQLRLKRCSDPTQRMPVNTTEEGMLLDFASASNAAETMFGIADQARRTLVSYESWQDSTLENSPPNKVFCLRTQLLVWREVQVARPVNNLAVCVVRLFSAERRPADEALKHDCTDGPPIAPEIVSLSTKDLRRYVVGSTHSRVC